MRLAHVISGLPIQSGGPSIACIEMARWQSDAGADCSILTGSDAKQIVDCTEAIRAGVKIESFARSGPEMFAYLPKYKSYLRKAAHFDLFVLHSSYQYPAYLTSKFCRATGIPYIFMPHGSLSPAIRRNHSFRNRLVDLAYHDNVIRNAAACHFTSEAERSVSERKIWRESFVEPLGIDIEQIPLPLRTGNFRSRYGIPENAVGFLFLSRIAPGKGVEMLLEAFSQIVGKFPRIYLALCGPIDSDLTPVIWKYLTKIPTGRLIITGMLVGKEKQQAYSDMDYFVLPSISENFGLSVLEAIAHGLPTITTTGVNIHNDLVQSGRTRIIEPIPQILQAELTNIAKYGWTPKIDVQTTRRWLDAKFSWRVHARRMLERYSEYVK
jgi:glycosyltransferase involved in cell wall biosynthesis